MLREPVSLRIRRYGALIVFSGFLCLSLAAPKGFSCCPVPGGESSDAYAQTSNSSYVLEYFEQTLLNPSSDPVGHTVEETYGMPGSNSCWFPGSDVPQNPRISGGDWTVNSSDQWGPDEVGLTDADAEQIWGAYYNGQISLPCTVTAYQNMQIECGDASLFYQYETNNALARTEDASHALQVCRDYTCGGEIPIY